VGGSLAVEQAVVYRQGVGSNPASPASFNVAPSLPLVSPPLPRWLAAMSVNAD
jgi:hypothetical protein